MADRSPSSLADDAAFVETLRLAVPLWIVEILRRPRTDRDRILREWPQGQHVLVKAADPEKGLPAEYTSEAQWISSRGDLLQFAKPQGARTAKDRQTTAVTFNYLARGLACAAFMDGGITFAGLHWCVDRHPTCPNEKTREEVS